MLKRTDMASLESTLQEISAQMKAAEFPPIPPSLSDSLKQLAGETEAMRASCERHLQQNPALGEAINRLKQADPAACPELSTDSFEFLTQVNPANFARRETEIKSLQRAIAEFFKLVS